MPAVLWTNSLTMSYGRVSGLYIKYNSIMWCSIRNYRILIRVNYCMANVDEIMLMYHVRCRLSTEKATISGVSAGRQSYNGGLPSASFYRTWVNRNRSSSLWSWALHVIYRENNRTVTVIDMTFYEMLIAVTMTPCIYAAVWSVSLAVH